MIKLNFKLNNLLKLSTICFLLSLAIILPTQGEESASTTPENVPETEVSTTTPDIIIETSTTTPEIIEPPTNTLITINLNLRHQNSLLFSGMISIPTSTKIIDTSNVEHLNTTNSVLNALVEADRQNENFSLSDIQYYSDWNSLYLKCISSSSIADKLCDNWNYVVNGTYPSIGIDQFMLTGGENIYIYFNNSRQITASASTLPVHTSTTFYTWRYNYDDLNNEWVKDGSDSIDISIPNPNSTGWWDTTLTTSTIESNTDGDVEYNFSTTGTYYVKITSADYSKWSWPITITVIDEPKIATTTDIITPLEPTPHTNNGGGGGSYSPIYYSLDIEKAVAYLDNKQGDGSFGGDLYADWAAIAYGAAGKNNDALKNYLINDTQPEGGLNELSNRARRAMALMALGINPYNGTGINYIQKIIDSYNNEQFGDKDLYNDDIFAIFPLLKSGYTIADEKISNSIKFIISKQSPNGSWDGVDLTAAAIQNLKNGEHVTGATEALSKARAYLLSTQQADGGFGNTFSTAWAIQAGAALGESNGDWSKKANDYLYSKQLANGGVEDNIWATAESIPAALNKSWIEILNSFTPPPVTQNSIAGSGSNSTASLAITTSTPITTSTLKIINNISTGTTPAASSIEPLIVVLGEKITTPEIILPVTKKIIKKIVTTQNQHLALPSPQRGEEKPPRASLSPPPTEGEVGEGVSLTNTEYPTTKKVAAVAGVGAIATGLYLGFRLLKTCYN